MMHFQAWQKYISTNIMLLLLIQLRFRPTMHLKMTFRTSVLWKLAKKWPEMVIKWPFVSCDFSIFFLTKLKKTEMTKIVFYVIVFDQLGFKYVRHIKTTIRTKNLSFMRNINVVAKKMARNGLKIANLLGCAFRFESDFNIFQKKSTITKIKD